jgi:hypothetical protein
MPAFAVRALVVNFRAPVGSAAIERELLEPAGALDVCVVDAVGVLDAALVLLLEPPQALRPTVRAAIASASLNVLGTGITSPCCSCLTGDDAPERLDLSGLAVLPQSATNGKDRLPGASVYVAPAACGHNNY